MGANRIRLTKRKLCAWCLAAVSVLALVQPAAAVPVYNIVPLGLDDLEHTRDDGYKFSAADELNEKGQIAGISKRYNHAAGQSAWIYSGATTIHIGLSGSEHTRNNGYKYSSVYQLNTAGQVIGRSDRYNGGSMLLGRSAWLFDGVTTIDIGLTGIEHTRDDEYKFSNAVQLNAAGQVIGNSDRYNGGNTSLGRSAWLFGGTTTRDIGLTAIEHTRDDGYKYSTALQLNAAGRVMGQSSRYNGSSAFFGNSVWIYDGATTRGIGLTGIEHTRNDGYKFSIARQLNGAGHASGYSGRFNGSSAFFGTSAWLYDGATSIDIGLTGIDHTRNDGYKYSEIFQLNEVGQVNGISYRYNGGSTDLGQSAWLYDGATTIDIGLTGIDHTRNDGYKYSTALQLNAAGRVMGQSSRYNGSNGDLGQSAWLYDGATTIDIGLTGIEHTRSDGYKISTALQLNAAGRVMGQSSRYNNGSGGLGQSAWLFDGATTIDIGLTGIEHTRDDGHKYSNAIQLNAAGRVIGQSSRFNGSTSLGFSVWLYDGTTMIDIGPTGSEYTSSSGYKYGIAGQLNEAGQVSGYSRRYNGGSIQLGRDAWFYDPTLNQTFALNLSNRSDGYAFSSADYLGEDGLVLGTYSLFDTLDNDLGPRAFYFTLADGLHDLGSLVDGGLAANDWDSLANAIRANGLGQILGHGKLTSQSDGQMAYLLTPVPEPTTALLATLAITGILLLRKQPSRPRS